jgi:hypothetical protein
LLEALSFAKLHKAQIQGLKSGEHDGHIRQDGIMKLHDNGEESLEYPEQCLRCAAVFCLMEQHKPVLNGTCLERNPVFSGKLSQPWEFFI